MKLLPENKKKAFGSLAVLILLVAATAYVYTRTLGRGGAPVTAPAAPVASRGSDLLLPYGRQMLPYGSQINTDVLNQDKFKALRPGPGLSVSSDQLGKADLFAK